MPPDSPVITLKPRGNKRLLQGHPWIYSNEIEMTAEAKALPAGGLVGLVSADGERLGTAIFNSHTLIAARLLSRDPKETIDSAFLERRLARALDLRARLIGVPYFRLVHAEADGLPGLIVDRYGDALALQMNSAGMAQLAEPLLAALQRLLQPKTIVLRNDSPARTLEGLESQIEVIQGSLAGPLELQVGARFFADLRAGQKTGWFYDQRDNRAWAAKLAAGAEVLDCYAYSGGFGIQAALAGATAVTAIDRSQGALDLAAQAAAANGVADRWQATKADVFQHLQYLVKQPQRFGLVIADPPAFVKSKKDLPQGLKAYRKLARLAASLVGTGGFLVLASCSQQVEAGAFAEQVKRGLVDARRGARILHSAGAAPDHPLHPGLPESTYLKALHLALD